MESIAIFGAGGHAKVVIDILEREGRYGVGLVVDDAPEAQGTSFFGYPLLRDREEFPARRESAGITGCIVAIGDNATRLKIAAWLLEHDCALVSTTHPSARLGRGVTVGLNTVITAACVINSDAAVGNSVIVNTAATIDHDCRIEDGVHVAPGSHICGGVLVGYASMVGAGTIITPGRTIGPHSILGAGSVVIEDIPAYTVAAGHPARVIKQIIR